MIQLSCLVQRTIPLNLIYISQATAVAPKSGLKKLDKERIQVMDLWTLNEIKGIYELKKKITDFTEGLLTGKEKLGTNVDN